jgi:hypothetical protein
MKVRNGFVSNSSSSSFVICVEKNIHDQAISKIHPYYKACLEAIGFEQIKAFGKDLVCFKEWNTAGGSMWEYVNVEYDGDMPETNENECYESLREYEKAVFDINKDSVLCISVDF